MAKSLSARDSVEIVVPGQNRVLDEEIAGRAMTYEKVWCEDLFALFFPVRRTAS